MRLTWTPVASPIFGAAFELQGLPEGASGSCYVGGDKRPVAHAFINGRYLMHKAHNKPAAMRRLEREIDRRSIGLLGVDDVEFVTATQGN